MKILVTYAVQGEFTELKFPGLIGEEEVHIGYIRTPAGRRPSTRAALTPQAERCMRSCWKR